MELYIKCSMKSGFEMNTDGVGLTKEQLHCNWESQIGKRHSFQAKFVFQNNKAALLRRIVSIDGTLFRDHLWIPKAKKFKLIENGDIIEFSAKVNRYWKGHPGVKMNGYYLYDIDQQLVSALTLTNINTLYVIYPKEKTAEN